MSKPTASLPGNAVAAIATERARVSAILESPEGKLRPALATELALRTNMDVASAVAVLAKSAPDNPYLAAMAIHGPLGIDPAGTLDPSAGAAPDAKAARLAEIEEMGKRRREEQRRLNARSTEV